MSSPPRASAVVKDCVKNCITHTFDFLFANCDEVYKRESKQQNNSTENPSEQTEDQQLTATSSSTTVVTPSLKSLEFWHQLMYLLSRIISEDRERYGLVLNQFVFEILFDQRKTKRRIFFLVRFRFPSELNVGHISAETIWKLLSDEIREHLDGKKNFIEFLID